jgi:hypothetical protein
MVKRLKSASGVVLAGCAGLKVGEIGLSSRDTGGAGHPQSGNTRSMPSGVAGVVLYFHGTTSVASG